MWKGIYGGYSLCPFKGWYFIDHPLYKEDTNVTILGQGLEQWFNVSGPRPGIPHNQKEIWPSCGKNARSINDTYA